MTLVLKLEYLALLGLSIILFSMLEFVWWWYPVLFLLPDVGIIGYLISNHVGSVSYNALHFVGTAVLVYAIGLLLDQSILMLAGVIILGHTGADRLLGFGLKYPDSFRHTHLGDLFK